MATTSKKKPAQRRRDRPSPRQRLLDAATKLFTEEGIRVIGIDRILREADVAKASLYSLLGSKDSLVIAYLEQLDEQFRARWGERAAKAPDADAKILAFFDMAIDRTRTSAALLSSTPRANTRAPRWSRKSASSRRAWRAAPGCTKRSPRC